MNDPDDEIAKNQTAEDEIAASDDAGDDDEEMISLEDLGAAYARAAAEHDPDAFGHLAETAAEPADDPQGVIDRDSTDGSWAESSNAASGSPDAIDGEDPQRIPTPTEIIEAALFVGHPENEPLRTTQLASLMRDVSVDEVDDAIAQLNESYKTHGQSLRIVPVDGGYRMTLSPAMENARLAFVGKIREARLNQATIEVLALAAYAPGSTANQINDRRGRESGPLLNQLVRRGLLMIERVRNEGQKRPIPHYYPTERFLHLFDLESLEDLPRMEEG